MNKKRVVGIILVLGVLLLSLKIILEALKSFLEFLAFLLLRPLQLEIALETAPWIGAVGGVGVALFAFLLILLLLFAVSIIEFLLSRP
jgi:hypothetical protein